MTMFVRKRSVLINVYDDKVRITMFDMTRSKLQYLQGKGPNYNVCKNKI